MVVEEFLEGEEASFIVMVDGKNVLPMASSQDHKARNDGDQGPNTGGMGAYSPAPIITAEYHERVMQEVIMPTIEGLSADGIPYTGFLYAGLMIAADGTPKVLEYNCRFGDPETQPIMLRLKSDLVAHCLAATNEKLDQEKTEWDSRPALGVVIAAGEYPAGSSKGEIINGLDGDFGTDCKVFHAGTKMDGDNVVTNGGRVLCVTAIGNKISTAQQHAYAGVEKINWKDCYCRGDIGYRAIDREKN